MLATGQVLPPSSSEWPPSQLRQLHAARTTVSEEGIALLSALPLLRFLDVRGTSVRRSVLAPLERQFGLQAWIRPSSPSTPAKLCRMNLNSIQMQITLD